MPVRMHLKEDKKSDEEELQEILSPPNGGYGWIVTLLAAINLFFAFGIRFSLGNLTDTFVQVLNHCHVFKINI